MTNPKPPDRQSIPMRLVIVNLKKELKALFRCMDFVSRHLVGGENGRSRYSKVFFDIYQHLGTAWEYLGLQCRHWEGYKKGREGKLICKICGKVKDAPEFYYLLPVQGPKKLGRRFKPKEDAFRRMAGEGDDRLLDRESLPRTEWERSEWKWISERSSSPR